jgi:uncharacterized membrane protein YfhO
MFIHKGLSKLGVNWFDMRHWYSEGIPAATDYLLGLKYLISNRNLSQEKGYERMVGIEDTAIFKNENALGVAILSNVDIQNVELGNDAFQNLNAVWKSMTGERQDIFSIQSDITYAMHNPTTDISVTSEELRDSVSQSVTYNEQEKSNDDLKPNSKATHNGPYIVYSFTAKKDGPVYIFDTSIPDSEHGIATPTMKYCGYYTAGQEVEGTLDVSGLEYVTPDFLRGYCANLVFAYADNNVLSEYAKQLRAREVTLNADKENDLTGYFEAGENQRLLFTLPWDEGWTLFVDGIEVPIDKTWDLFMSANVPVGEHQYELRFIPAWMNIGIGLSATSTIGLIMIVFPWRKRICAKRDEQQVEVGNK